MHRVRDLRRRHEAHMSLLLATVQSMSLLGHEMGERSLWMRVGTSLSHGSMLVTFVTAFRSEGTAGGGVGSMMQESDFLVSCGGVLDQRSM